MSDLPQTFTTLWDPIENAVLAVQAIAYLRNAQSHLEELEMYSFQREHITNEALHRRIADAQGLVARYQAMIAFMGMQPPQALAGSFPVRTREGQSQVQPESIAQTEELDAQMHNSADTDGSKNSVAIDPNAAAQAAAAEAIAAQREIPRWERVYNNHRSPVVGHSFHECYAPGGPKERPAPLKSSRHNFAPTPTSMQSRARSSKQPAQSSQPSQVPVQDPWVQHFIQRLSTTHYVFVPKSTQASAPRSNVDDSGRVSKPRHKNNRHGKGRKYGKKGGKGEFNGDCQPPKKPGPKDDQRGGPPSGGATTGHATKA